MTDNFDLRLDEVERAFKVIKTIENAGLQTQAFELLFGAAASTPARPAEPKQKEAAESSGADSTGDTGTGTGAKPRATAKRAKAPAITADRSVNLSPGDEPTWVDFAAAKAPSNQNEQYAVAVHWLKESGGVSKATVAQVLFLYIAAKWTLPGDPRNAASQAARKGYFTNGDPQDLIMTSHGTALVVNELPRR